MSHLNWRWFRVSLSVIFLSGMVSSYAQTDSLDLLVKSTQSLSDGDEKLKNLNEIAAKYVFIDPGKGVEFAEQAYELASKLGKKEGMAEALQYWGNNYTNLSMADSGVNKLEEAVILYTELNDTVSIADCYQSIGVNYGRLGNVEKGIPYLYNALELCEKSKDTFNLMRTCNNMGMCYYMIDDLENAEKYFLRSLDLSERKGSKKGISHAYNNLGMIYGEGNQLDKALEYFRKNLVLCEEMGNEFEMASAYINIGHILRMTGQFEEAIVYYNKSIPLCIKLENISALVASYEGAGMLYTDMKQFDKAIEYLNLAVQTSNDYGLKKEKETSLRYLSEAYFNAGNYLDAYQNHVRYSDLKDSIFTEQKSKQINELETKYQTEKKEQEITLLNKQKEVDRAEIQRKNVVNISAIAGGILILIFSIVIYNRLKITKKQKIVIEEQNEELNAINEEVVLQRDEIQVQKSLVELKNKEITDSINYAKRIQDAILPPQSLLNQNLNEHFVLYLPKDIVAGDFYWMETKGNLVFFAVADCTGHGVPGAIVSVVCHNALNRAVREFALNEPGQILDKVRLLVLSTFERSEEQVKDGMDIALCILDKSTNQLLYSGANNPLYVLQKDQEEFDIVKADKQPIGYSLSPYDFSTHTINLKKGDQIYIFSDGFADQFGGPKGKKYGYKQFRNFLIEQRELPVEQQQVNLTSEFQSWLVQGNEEQLDDVCVIGMKV